MPADDRVGRVILLNGAPSSGKTTIARALQEVLDPPHWYRSLDDFRKGYLDRHLESSRGPWWTTKDRTLFELVLRGYLRALREMALVGNHVISEAVILPASLGLYLEAFSRVPVLLIAVRCPLPVAERRERERTDRHLGRPIELAVPEFDLVHSHGAYDAEVDTSVTSVADSVAAIVALVAAPPSPTAIERLANRRNGGPASSTT